MRGNFVFTSESVTDGHPDKLCDQISDALVGRYLQQDAASNIVAECAVSTGIVFVAVKMASDATVDVPFTARDVIRAAGYEGDGFNARDCTVMTSVTEVAGPRVVAVSEEELSEEEIARIPARDQVTVFGFACTQTPMLMPLPIWLAHKLARRLADVRRSGELPYLVPDGKTQVGVEFRARRPVRIHSLTLVTSHAKRGVALDRLRLDLRDVVVGPAFEGEPIRPDPSTRIAINPEGLVIQGGPSTHSGLTGRKTAVDTYGEYARHSGAALSGKDPSRIDRVGAYAARYAAKNIVAAGLAAECEVQLSYSIGQAQPVSIEVETFGTSAVSETEIIERVKAVFDFRPAAIVRRFRLRSLAARAGDGVYRKLAAYGHMGRTDLDLPWEATDRAEQLGRG